MVSFNESIGLRIRNLRKKVGLSQLQVAEELHVKRETYNTIENGHRAIKDSEIIDLARILDTSTDFILSGVKTSYIEVAKETGLSNETIDALRKWKKEKDVPYSVGYDYREVIESLITTKEGNRVLELLINYLDGDFSQLYTEKKNGDLIAHRQPIVFKHIDGTYSYLEPELCEQIVLNNVINAVKALKEMRQGKGEGK